MNTNQFPSDKELQEGVENALLTFGLENPNFMENFRFEIIQKIKTEGKNSLPYADYDLNGYDVTQSVLSGKRMSSLNDSKKYAMAVFVSNYMSGQPYGSSIKTVQSMQKRGIPYDTFLLKMLEEYPDMTKGERIHGTYILFWTVQTLFEDMNKKAGILSAIMGNISMN